MLTCYIIDDECYAVETISKYISQTAELELIGCSSDPVKFLADLQAGVVADVIFSDIEMPGLNGLELSEFIPRESAIVFTSAHSQYAIEAFNVDAFGYLLKPFPYNRFLKIVQRLLESRSRHQQEDGYFYLKGDAKGKLLRIDVKKVVYLESAQNYITINFESGTAVTSYMKISEMTAFLPKEQFTRVHRSFIINHEQISFIAADKIIMKNGSHIPLSDSFKNVFLSKIIPKTIISDRLKF